MNELVTSDQQALRLQRGPLDGPRVKSPGRFPPPAQASGRTPRIHSIDVITTERAMPRIPADSRPAWRAPGVLTPPAPQHFDGIGEFGRWLDESLSELEDRYRDFWTPRSLVAMLVLSLPER
jgi:hypothetical protein